MLYTKPIRYTDTVYSITLCYTRYTIGKVRSRAEERARVQAAVDLVNKVCSELNIRGATVNSSNSSVSSSGGGAAVGGGK